MDVMYNKKTGERVEVFAIDVDHNTAMFFNTSLAAKNGGNGWQKAPMKQLIPEAYYEPKSGTYISKTERNEVKSRLHLVDAIWECEDGVRFTHKDIDSAIEHQRSIMNKEDETNE